MANKGRCSFKRNGESYFMGMKVTRVHKVEQGMAMLLEYRPEFVAATGDRAIGRSFTWSLLQSILLAQRTEQILSDGFREAKIKVKKEEGLPFYAPLEEEDDLQYLRVISAVQKIEQRRREEEEEEEEEKGGEER
uniref:Uncharacterized protein n=1 Tax=Nelumbo nucifera TaxID=4432 RepID=A0A822ZRL5_NELNU|nr:TPA_asm: hypothetical protein HUJ06_004219 [Nelumbo nucifera]